MYTCNTDIHIYIVYLHTYIHMYLHTCYIYPYACIHTLQMYFYININACIYMHTNICLFVCLYINAALFRIHFNMTDNDVTYRLNEKVKVIDPC